MGEAIAIPPRRWLGFIPEPAGAVDRGGGAAQRCDATPISPRRWLGFIPDPPSHRNAATWGIPAAGAMMAVGLFAAVLATGGVAEGNESDGAVIGDALEPDANGEEIAHASVVAEPEPIVEPTPAAALTPEPAAAPASAPVVAAEAPRARKRPTFVPMTPAQLRKAQRVAKMLDTAVTDGRVHTSTLSFAVLADSEGTFWSEASTMCNQLDVDGVAGWRLPSVGELRDLGRSRALPRAAYWSRSHGRDPETAMVYNTRTRRSGAWLLTEPTGATVCVQPRPRVPPAEST